MKHTKYLFFNNIIFMLFLSLFLLLPACHKAEESTTTGNPVVNLSMTSSQNSDPVSLKTFVDWLMHVFMPQATASSPPSLTDSAGNTITLSQGWMVVKEIELKPTETANSEERTGEDIKFLGPYVVNLFSSTPSNLGSSTVTLSSIRRIKMKLHNLESSFDGSPQELISNSIFFKGNIGDKEFSISSHDGTEFEIGGSSALNVKESMNLLVIIKIIPLINKINLSSLLSQTSPITINDSQKGETGTNICPLIDLSSTSVFDCFRKGLEQQANLGEDSNNNGEIEDNESEVKN